MLASVATTVVANREILHSESKTFGTVPRAHARRRIGRKGTSLYGPPSNSSASTRQERSPSGALNGGWYSKPVTTEEPGCCRWCRNHSTTETVTMAMTQRMTRPDSSPLDSVGQSTTRVCDHSVQIVFKMCVCVCSGGKKKLTFFGLICF